MIKKSVYIREFSDKQRLQLQKIQAKTNIKTVSGILLHALDAYQDQEKEVERLKRIIAYKQNKIDNLKSQ